MVPGPADGILIPGDIDGGSLGGGLLRSGSFRRFLRLFRRGLIRGGLLVGRVGRFFADGCLRDLFRDRIALAGLFGRGKNDRLDYEVEEDTIYGIDFDKAIRQALERKDYREAVRLKYLQTLKMLTENGRIDWQLHKTPTQYTYECTDEAFLRMTRHFLRIRYGNFEATPEVYEELATAYSSLFALHTSHQKGGDA